MAGRIRSIKPEWLDDEKLASMSDEARLLSVALILLADDHGNGRANPLFLASRAWPYGDADESLAKLSRGIRELSSNTPGATEDDSYIVLYTVKKQAYFSIRNWKKHQRVDKPSKPLVPGPQVPEATASAGLGEAFSSHNERTARDPRETLAPDLDLDLERRGEDRDAREARESTDPTPTSAAPTDPLLVLHRLAEKHGGWIGDLRASDRVRRSANQVIDLAIATARKKQTTWDHALALVLERWFDDKPARVNLPNWPEKLCEDWQATAALVDQQNPTGGDA